MSSTKKTAQYNPFRYRRRVDRVSKAAGLIEFKTLSFTRNDGTRYEVLVNVLTGFKMCSCPDFTYNRAGVGSCKHMERAIANCVRHGELPPQPKTKPRRKPTLSDIAAPDYL